MWCVFELVYSRVYLCYVGGRIDLYFLYFLILGVNCYWFRLILLLYVISYFFFVELKLWLRDGVLEDCLYLDVVSFELSRLF